jgi:MFS family permease
MLTLGFIPLSAWLIFTSGQWGLILSYFMIIPPLGFFIPGLIMLGSGLKLYKKRRQNCDSTVLAEHYKSKIKNWETLSKVFGIISGVGLTVGGIGAGMICGGTINTYNEPLFVCGSILSGVGAGALIGALPMLITSLAMSAWLKGQTNRLSVDIGVTSGNNGELSCDKKRNVLEKPSGVKLAMSVKF